VNWRKFKLSERPVKDREKVYESDA